MKSIVVATFSIILLFSCQKDGPSISEFNDLNPALRPYFQAFEYEGQLRGVPIDIEARGITAVIEEIAQQHVAGSCRYSNQNPNHITIDLGFWNNSSPLFKEFIIFHELGHCYLFRDHEESADNFGRCRSIMRSGLGNCRDNYRAETRDRYLDELFANF